MPGFMADLRGKDGFAPRALEFCILTATRTGEVLQAQWSQIDMEDRVWVIPAVAMKAGREHRVPLCDRAIEILEDLKAIRLNDYVVPGRGKSSISNMAMASVLKRMGRSDITVHGFRSSFRDFASEATNAPHEVAEMALAHTIANKAEAAYRRGDLFEKRRDLMNAWAAWCAPKTGNVLTFSESRVA
jgi:integrase